MIAIGTLHPTNNVPMPADTVFTMLVAGSIGQAMDWPANADIVRFTGLSTLGADLNFQVDLRSTKAAAPSSGGATIGSTLFYGYTVMEQGMFQVPGASTGFSVAALSSGYISAEIWRRG